MTDQHQPPADQNPDHDPDPDPDLADLGYTEAIDELDEILQTLERSDVDVDVLAERVARAAQLISVCRTRIGAARLQVEQVVADLDAHTAEPRTDR